MTEFEDNLSLGAGRGFACVDTPASVLRGMLSICRMNELLKVPVMNSYLSAAPAPSTALKILHSETDTHPFLVHPLLPHSHPLSWTQGPTTGLSPTPSV